MKISLAIFFGIESKEITFKDLIKDSVVVVAAAIKGFVMRAFLSTTTYVTLPYFGTYF